MGLPGALLQHHAGELNFAPFGQTVSGSTSDSFRFTGLEFDTLTGLDHATARQFHPNEGRWISPDAFTASYNWADPQTLNRYGYVNNRPMTLTDPSGQCPECMILIACATDPICLAGTGAAIAFDKFLLVWLFPGPTFHGTLKLRPGAASQHPWDDTFGIPYPGLNSSIS